MSRFRKTLVSALAFALVFASLTAIAVDRELWPISQYPMYSRIRGDTVWRSQMYGITGDGERLLDAGEAWRTSNVWLHMTLVRIRDSGDPSRLQRAARELLAEYERRRVAGLHDGPPLHGIRLYRVRWKLRPRAENKDRPDERQLVLEARLERRGNGLAG